jgi:acyl carrier protein phosphodiesterase
MRDQLLVCLCLKDLLKRHQAIYLWQESLQTLFYCAFHYFADPFGLNGGALRIFTLQKANFINANLHCLFDHPLYPVYLLGRRNGQVQRVIPFHLGEWPCGELNAALFFRNGFEQSFVKITEAVDEPHGITCFFPEHFGAVPAFIRSKQAGMIFYSSNKYIHSLKIAIFIAMNYLAHAFLSNNNKDLLIGNFIADHVRGNHFENYPEEIVKGIYLHRQIDTFTDAHPLFKASKRLFYEGFEKYSGVLVDIYFDHLLARDFETYSIVPLKQFSKTVYDIYQQSQSLLPQHSSNFLDYVLKNDIYTSYSLLEGIERVLFHLSQRINHQVRLDQSIPLFSAHEKELQQNFDSFFKEAMAEFIK